MRYPFSGRLFAIVAATVFLGGVHSQTWANGGEARPMELRRIMKQLGKDMQVVTDGISREDWALVARVAPRIADHPQPPVGEKMRILAFIGSDVGKFKGFDEQTHNAAKAMQAAAERGDGKAVIAAFANLQNSCLGCHQSYRKPFVEHFYGQH